MCVRVFLCICGSFCFCIFSFLCLRLKIFFSCTHTGLGLGGLAGTWGGRRNGWGTGWGNGWGWGRNNYHNTNMYGGAPYGGHTNYTAPPSYSAAPSSSGTSSTTTSTGFVFCFFQMMGKGTEEGTNGETDLKNGSEFQIEKKSRTVAD